MTKTRTCPGRLSKFYHAMQKQRSIENGVRRFASELQQSALVSLSKDARSGWLLLHQENGAVKQDSTNVELETHADGTTDLVLDPIPYDLKLLGAYVGDLTIPHFDPVTIPIVERALDTGIRLSASPGSLAAAGEDDEIDFGDEFVIASFKRPNVRWDDGKTMQVTLNAPTGTGPYFAMVTASWEDADGTEREFSKAVVLREESGDGIYLAMVPIFRPKNPQVLSVMMRPLRSDEAYCLSADTSTNELSDKTEFLLLMPFEARTVIIRGKTARIKNVLPANLHRDRRTIKKIELPKLTFLGLSARREVAAEDPFSSDFIATDFLELWLRVEPRLARQVKKLFDREGPDANQEVALKAWRCQRRLLAIAKEDGIDGVVRYLSRTMVNLKFEKGRRGEGRPKEVNVADSDEEGNEVWDLLAKQIVKYRLQSEDDEKEIHRNWVAKYLTKLELDVFTRKQQRQFDRRQYQDGPKPWSTKFIANEMGFKEDKVRSTYERAQKKIVVITGLFKLVRDETWHPESLVTEEEFEAVAQWLQQKKCNRRDNLILEMALRKTYAAVAILELRSRGVITNQQMDVMERWLFHDDRFADVDYQLLGRWVHAMVLVVMDRRDGPLKKIGRDYLLKHVIGGLPWDGKTPKAVAETWYTAATLVPVDDHGPFLVDATKVLSPCGEAARSF